MEDAAEVRKRLLLTVLESGDTNAKILALLRKWAKEGRPYKGHIFKQEEVEEAIKSISSKCEVARAAKPELVPTPSRAPSLEASSSASGKSATPTSGCASFVANRCVMVNAKSSRPKEILQAAAVVAQSLADGASRYKVAADGANLDQVLKGLYEVGAGREPGRVQHPDVQIGVGSGASVGAHKDILRAMLDISKLPALQCIDCSQFGFAAVSAAVEFAYRGACKVPIGDLVNLLLFADFFKCRELLDAVEHSLVSLPVVRSLEVLASLDKDSVIATDLLSRNALPSLLQSSAKTFSGVADVLLKTVAVAPTSVRIVDTRDQSHVWTCETADRLRSDDRVSQCWAFVNALLDVLGQLSPEAMGRLRCWISCESDPRVNPLRDAVEKFMVEAIRASSSYAAAGLQPTDLTCICKRHFKGWLPEDLILKIIRELAQRDGFVRHVAGPNGLSNSQPHRWLQWTYSGGPTLPVMMNIHNLVKNLIEEAMPAVHTSSDSVEDSIGSVEPQDVGTEYRAVMLSMSGMLARNFGAAFVEETYQNPLAVTAETPSSNSWEVLQQGLDEGLLVTEEALRLLVRHVRRGKTLPPGLPPKMMGIVLRETLVGASASAVRVSGPPSIAGVFERSRGSQLEFRRKSSEGPELALRRVVRSSGRDAISIVWPGIPSEDCRRATAEWKIQIADEDERFDCPLAVALTANQDPCDINVSWWFCATTGKFRGQFRHDDSIEVQLESVHDDDAIVCQEVLIAWVQGGGSLDDLIADLKANAASGPVLLMCHEAARSLTPAKAAEEVQRTPQLEDESKPACQVEVSDASSSLTEMQTSGKEDIHGNWKEAVADFKVFADELVQLISAICSSQGENDIRQHLKRKRDLEDSDAYVKAIRRLEEVCGK